MDFKESGIDSNESKIPLEVDLPKSNDPIITFSPDRSRFDPGGQTHKSRNASIASDFDLNLEVSYSTVDIKVNHQNPPPNSVTPSLTDLLSSSENKPQAPPLSQLKSTENFSGGGVDNIINNFNLDLKHELGLSLTQNQIQAVENNVNGSTVSGNGSSGQSMSTLVTAPVAPSTKGTSLSLARKMSLNGTTSETQAPNTSTTASTVQLQKKLERKIAQASAIAAAMNSMAPNNPNESSSPTLLSSPKDETEFGDWNTHFKEPAISNYCNSNSNPTSKVESKHDNPTSATTTDSPIPTSKSAGKSKSSRTKHSTAYKNSRYSSSTEDRQPACVKFQENEVEIICKSTRTKVAGGSLLPPERLAVPHKGLLTNNSSTGHNSRKQSSGDGSKSGLRSKEDNSSQRPTAVDGGGGGSHPNSGSTSEVKPLVEWDSDESEEELSFFPAGKPKAKLTDNLSIDNMSLSGEEDDLHLSPPRAMSQKCPCDPRQWIQDKVDKLPKSNSFPGQGGQCIIS